MEVGRVTAAMIGLGNLGGRMAVRLRDQGIAVVGFDVRPDRAGELGLAAASSMREACRNEVVLLSLPSDAVIDEVILGAGGVRDCASPGTVAVDLSTASPARTRERHEALAQRGIALLDVGVSGGPKAAESGTLSLIAGGDTSVIERVRPVLEAIGNRLFHVGGPGSGHAAKVLNNYLNGVNLAATAEAVVLGVRAGLDPRLLLEVLNASTGANWATANRFPSIIEGDYLEGGLSNDLMAKDLDLYLDLARENGAPALIGSTTRALFGVAIAIGYGGQVSNTVVDAIGDLAGGTRVQKPRSGEASS